MSPRPAKASAEAPRTRDAERTRQIILEAATAEFASLAWAGPAWTASPNAPRSTSG